MNPREQLWHHWVNRHWEMAHGAGNGAVIDSADFLADLVKNREEIPDHHEDSERVSLLFCGVTVEVLGDFLHKRQCNALLSLNSDNLIVCLLQELLHSVMELPCIVPRIQLFIQSQNLSDLFYTSSKFSNIAA
uniref:Uncharacterized protein n=1 Tax=Arundo donax TaxID=35708 RepID=A0A0A9DXM6_ARUDO